MLTLATVQSFTKEAISRMDKEVAKGNIRYSDVVPEAASAERSIPGFNTPPEAAKLQARQSLMAPAEVSSDRLARTRQLKGKLYDAQVAHGAQGLSGLGIYGEAGKGKVVNTPLPGGGPATAMGQVYAPASASRFMNTVEQGRPNRAVLSTIAEQFGDRGRMASNLLLSPGAAYDPTLSLAVLQHELGEANTAGRGRITPFASHLGVEPILRENFSTQGDPGAQRAMSRIRQLDPGDAFAQKAIRQAGGRPDAPLALGGRQQRAVESILNRKFSTDPTVLSPQARQKVYQAALTNKLHPGMSLETTYGVPEHTLPDVDRLKGVLEKTKGHLQAKDYRSAAREVLPHVKPNLAKARAANEYIQYGGPPSTIRAAKPGLASRLLSTAKKALS